MFFADSLFIPAPILLAFCFVHFMNAMFYVLSASCFIVVVFIMECDCWCSVCLSRGDMG